MKANRMCLSLANFSAINFTHQDVSLDEYGRSEDIKSVNLDYLHIVTILLSNQFQMLSASRRLL